MSDLRAILANHVRNFRQPWPGCEFGKAIVGGAVLGALEDHGCDRREELQRAMEAAA